MNSDAVLQKNRISFKNAVFYTCLVLILLVLVHILFSSARTNPWFAIYPRQWKSLVAVITSNFLHSSDNHLIGNLFSWILIAPFAFWLEGKRAFSAMFLSILFAGIAIFFFGQSGSRHVGFSGVVCGMTAVAFLGMLRSHRIWLLPFALLAFFPLFGESIMTTLWPSKIAVENHISWLGHLGGFLGGMIAITNSPSRSLEILFANDIISEEEFVKISDRIEYDLDVKNTDTSKPASSITVASELNSNNNAQG